MVTYLKSSTTAKEKLQQIQVQLGRHEVSSTYQTRDAVAAALPTLPTDLHPLTNDFECASKCIKMLSPFHAATVELLHEKRVSGSKIIPLIKMLNHAFAEVMAQNPKEMAKQLGIKLNRVRNETQWSCIYSCTN